MPSNILAGRTPAHTGWFYATFNAGVHDNRFLSRAQCAKVTAGDCGSMYERGGAYQPVDGSPYQDVVGGQELGTCIMRTRDLTDPASWRAWGGAGPDDFTVDLSTTPYPAGSQRMRSCAVLLLFFLFFSFFFGCIYTGA